MDFVKHLPNYLNNLDKASKMVKTIENLYDFKKELNQAEDKLVVVYFYVSWCRQCKLLDEVDKGPDHVQK